MNEVVPRTLDGRRPDQGFFRHLIMPPKYRSSRPAAAAEPMRRADAVSIIPTGRSVL
jgi:hypothetical protein